MGYRQDLEDGLRNWIKTATGLDDAHVIWKYQNAVRPTGAFAELQITSERLYGGQTLGTEDYDPARPAGGEIRLRWIAQSQGVFQATFYAPTPAGDGSAFDLAETAWGNLGLTSVREAMSDLGVSIYDDARITNVPAIVGTAFEARAVLEVQFYSDRGFEEFTGYISTVDVEYKIDTDGDGNANVDETRTVTVE